MATAHAMAEALHELRPQGVRTQVSDVMAEFGFGRLDRRHKDSWRSMLRRPHMVRVGQRLMDAAPGLTRAAQNALLNDFARTASERIDALAPDLVVANHGWRATALTLARSRHGMRTRMLVFATEPFDASALWAEPKAEWVVAPSAAANEDLVRLGVPEQHVLVLGYPVRRAFLTPPQQAAARTALGLESDFTCLLSLGAEGVAGAALELAETLARLDVRVVAVAGRNAELERGFARLAAHDPRVTAVGFTERMPEYLAAADLVVGKAGPASTMEALAVGRPVVATSYAGLNEERVVRFLQSRALGGYAPTASALSQQVAEGRQPDRLEGARQAAAALNFGAMSGRLAEHLLALARGEPAPAGLVEAALEGAFESTSARSLAGSVTGKRLPRS